MNIGEFSLQIADLVTPFIVMMVGIIVAFWIKDFAVKIAAGMSFKYFGPFKEGDIVQLDGKKAMVIKIGLMMTVFGYKDPERGYIWRYVPNQKISGLKLGKVVSNYKKETKP
jgi:small-conductance mechanosensitive channel